MQLLRQRGAQSTSSQAGTGSGHQASCPWHSLAVLVPKTSTQGSAVGPAWLNVLLRGSMCSQALCSQLGLRGSCVAQRAPNPPRCIMRSSNALNQVSDSLAPPSVLKSEERSVLKSEEASVRQASVLTSQVC